MVSETKYKFEPDYAIPPGETVQETLDHLGMSQADLAERTGKTPKHINEIVKGKAPITPGTSLELERVLGAPANFWNNLEKNYREALARLDEKKRLDKEGKWLEKFPLKDLTRWGIVSKGRDKVQKVSELLHFFAVGNSGAWRNVWAGERAVFRKSPAFRQSPEAVSAWLRMGELQAQEIGCLPFIKEKFQGVLRTIRRDLILKPVKTLWPELVELCSRAGVAVVCVPELNKTHLSGATHWLNSQKAVIQLSFRGKSNDHFWFTFFHEAGHILKHGKKEGFIEDGAPQGEKEEEANKFAADYLLGSREYRDFLAGGSKNKTSIRAFAKNMGLPPGIVVGRLQHDGHVPRGFYNDLKVYFPNEMVNQLSRAERKYNR
ncbi:hypothetical protein UR09_05735 [Candidatus Nitromaritima sp. SCGC AAA799-A02]|nr:hypothetical protein UR09_05735 [Candidatus Nitromaritima sp. SCGC AAA799-A02]